MNANKLLLHKKKRSLFKNIYKKTRDVTIIRDRSKRDDQPIDHIIFFNFKKQ